MFDSLATDVKIDRGRTTLAHRVEELLRRQIVKGVYPAGSRLNEVEIAAAFDVSRGPVREALQRLSRDGLVVIEVHRGAFVKKLDREELIELSTVRIALEVEAAGLASQFVTDAQIAELLEMQKESISAVADEFDHGFPEVIDLHGFISRASGNQRLINMLSQVDLELRLVRSRSGSASNRAQKAIEEHDELVRCLSERDGRGARIAMRSHLEASLEHTLSFMYS
jgi:DNA-binding GntR family transcriptional regulator